jgi:internalin A
VPARRDRPPGITQGRLEVGMPDQAKPVARPWRRFVRLTVRGLIVFVLLIGAGLGWLVRSAHIQRDAVAAITNAGGSVYYDWEKSNGVWISGGHPWAPRWLVNRIGVDYFGHVTSVWFTSSSTATDATIDQVLHLSQLEELCFIHSSLTDAGLARLTGLNNVKRLDLTGTQVTDAGLVHLEGLSNLSDLVFYGAEVTDSGLAQVKRLNNLSTIELGPTQISDAGLAHLKGLTKLSYLSLGGRRVTDAGLVHLKGLKNLWVLELYSSQVTDAGIDELKQALSSLTIRR